MYNPYDYRLALCLEAFFEMVWYTDEDMNLKISKETPLEKCKLFKKAKMLNYKDLLVEKYSLVCIIGYKNGPMNADWTFDGTFKTLKDLRPERLREKGFTDKMRLYKFVRRNLETELFIMVQEPRDKT